MNEFVFSYKLWSKNSLETKLLYFFSMACFTQPLCCFFSIVFWALIFWSFNIIHNISRWCSFTVLSFAFVNVLLNLVFKYATQLAVFSGNTHLNNFSLILLVFHLLNQLKVKWIDLLFYYNFGSPCESSIELHIAVGPKPIWENCYTSQKHIPGV